jgi:hypothetical protein
MTDVKNATIFELLGAAKHDIGAVGKNDKNQMQHFNFRGIDAVVNAVAPVFNALGIITVPEVTEQEYEQVTVGAKGTLMGHVTLIVKYHFYGPKGDVVTATVASESMDAGDKAVPKAMSVAYRTALLQVLNLPTDEPDPDSVSYERSGGSPKAEKLDVDWADEIYKVLTIDALREVWKKAGAAGVLKDDVVTRAGEKVTVQQLLLNRNDDISFQDDNSSSGGSGSD